MPLLEHLPLELDVDVVLRAQGADPDVIRARRPALVQAAEDALSDARPLLAPRVLYETYAVADVRHKAITLAGGAKLRGTFLAEHLAPSREVVVAVCTVGKAIEDHISHLFGVDPVMALAVDGVGVAAVEALSVNTARFFEEQAAARGWSVTVPLSPGMEGWTVEEGQPQLFDLVDAGRIGVSLTEHCLMRPSKSLSLVVGLGPDVTSKGTPCDYCAVQATCRYRRHD